MFYVCLPFRNKLSMQKNDLLKRVEELSKYVLILNCFIYPLMFEVFKHLLIAV